MIQRCPLRYFQQWERHPEPRAAHWELIKMRSWILRLIFSATAYFDADYYLSTNVDVAVAGVDPFEHYMLHGWREGRRPSDKFDPLYYSHLHKLNNDVNPLIHVLRHSLLLSRDLRPIDEQGNIEYQITTITPYVDKFYYRSFYNISEDIDVVEHYLRDGWKRGYNPSLSFSTRDHLARHPFVSHIGASPLYHRLVTYTNELESVEFEESTVGPHARLCSAIECRSATVVRGWAFDPDRRGTSVILDVTLDSIAFARVRASQPRPDVTALNPDVVDCGFEIALPPGKGAATLGIFWKGAPLRGTPIEIELQPAPRGALAATPMGSVAVVIPIYNAVEATRRCLESIVRYTTLHARLIIIDDASSDPAIRQLLRTYDDHADISIHLNEDNLGYTKTVNLGISLAGVCDVVLLNSDTEVGPRWLHNLRQAAYSCDDIASVTAVSDNAGAFSVPEMNRQGARPGGCSIEDYQRLVLQNSSSFLPEVPTGNGFCLYLRRDAINAIGVFDADAFPRGYGEENDWSMRALRQGWRHLIDDRTLVHHVRSASFGLEKAKFNDHGRAVLDNRYPEYRFRVHQFNTSATLNAVRHCIRRLHADFEGGFIGIPRPRALFVISTTTGGTPMTNRDLMRGVADSFEPWLLHCDRYAITLRKVGPSDHEDTIVESVELAEAIDIVQHGSYHYTQTVRDWFSKYAFEIMHVRHLAWHGMDLPKIARQAGIPTVFSFHDYYSICPSLKLLDESLTYCAGRCTSSEGDCVAELWNSSNLPPLKKRWVYDWQARFAGTFESCSAFVTTSSSAKAILEGVFPSLVGRNFEVIEHGRDFARMHAPTPFVGGASPLNILVPGNISSAKGRDLIAAIAAIDGGKRLRFHILGNSHPPLSGDGVVIHGPYRRREFADLGLATGAQIGAIFSIWPETYCHTLSELWSIGLPVIGLDFGAVAERIRRTKAGWIVDHDSAIVLYEAICKIISDPADIRHRQELVRAWQLGEGISLSRANMATQYKRLYSRVIDDSRSFR